MKGVRLSGRGGPVSRIATSVSTMSGMIMVTSQRGFTRRARTGSARRVPHRHRRRHRHLSCLAHRQGRSHIVRVQVVRYGGTGTGQMTGAGIGRSSSSRRSSAGATAGVRSSGERVRRLNVTGGQVGLSQKAPLGAALWVSIRGDGGRSDMSRLRIGPGPAVGRRYMRRLTAKTQGAAGGEGSRRVRGGGQTD